VPDRLSPLVPLKLQPDATAANLRQRSLDATRALVQSAPVMAGSYTGRLAPQVRACAKIKSFDQDAWSGKRPLDSFVAATLDEAREISGPPFDTSQEARGGTSIIKAQSQCPFRAFATYRLKARPLDDASFGFDPLDRGTFLHNALQRVWQKLGDHAALRAASEDELREIIHAAIQASVKEGQQSGFYTQTTQVEQQRLEALILEWLITIERPRTVPFTVEATENELHIKLGGLPLHVRIDRVDRLQNGGLVLIDYKSGGEVNKNKLRGECPAEPQLLVYAAAESRRVEGLLFGYVAPRDLAMKGLTRSKILDSRTVEGCDREWDTFLEEARDEVKRLAADFVRGHALVDPAKNACTYCELAPLCRKNERICGEDAE
jgi:ATP-dependent helicase/DNAse subunit B